VFCALHRPTTLAEAEGMLEELSGVVGESPDMVRSRLRAVVPGARLGDVSHAIESEVLRLAPAPDAYGILEDYGGHGIGSSMHMEPHVLNYGDPGKGPELVEGMALAIEPMLILGSPDVRTLADNWTVASADGGMASHWEHTIALTADGPWVTTAIDGGLEILGHPVPSD
jgi:methionyl aminopeptidase